MILSGSCCHGQAREVNRSLVGRADSAGFDSFCREFSALPPSSEGKSNWARAVYGDSDVEWGVGAGALCEVTRWRKAGLAAG